MTVRRSSRASSAGRKVTPMRAAAAPSFSYFQTHGSKRSRSAPRGRQLSKLKGYGCNKDSFRVMKADGRCLNGGTLTSAHGEGTSAAGASEDFSQDSTSIVMPSGVSSFLLDCLDVDSPASDEDSTLSSIEEFRRADNYDGGSALPGDGLMDGVKNSTLLDLSHAQDIALQPLPNLSSILELSLDPAEEKEREFSLSPVRLSPARVSSDRSASGVASGTCFSPCVSYSRSHDRSVSLRSVQERTPVNTRPVILSPAGKKCFAEKRKLIKCRKVTFSDIVRVRNVSSHRRDKTEQRDERVQPRSEESSDIPSGPVRFFVFADECERESFFHRLKQTRSFTFPAKPVTLFLIPHRDTFDTERGFMIPSACVSVLYRSSPPSESTSAQVQFDREQI
ncbi:uncharacterized protein LOC125253528 isoform X2 [Megalobrama amblycephala]|uniref:uncharacterized protein LOC125253528 isoform X2 n=1 Tax=Megalobrama amblycephala TaxID=75352 RepID=UPI002013FBE3|nr:uncharacterized protein LOC125253528 isoform X2 [Megalobrama amblycephala]